MTDIIQSILAIKSDANVSVSGNDVNNITCHDGNPTSITNDAILAKQTELQTAYDAKAYARTRASAFPPIGDQLDMLWHAIDADTTLKSNYADFHTAIKAVKDANPKP